MKNDEKIIIGADKRILEADTIISEESSKILIKEFLIEDYNPSKNKHGEFLIAFSGLYSLFELLKTFNAPRINSKDTFHEYLYKTFIPELNAHLQKYNFFQDYV